MNSTDTPDPPGTSREALANDADVVVGRPKAFVHPMAVFLTDKYRSLDLFRDLGEEERRMRQEMLLQAKWRRAGENFFRESCLVKGCLTGAGGGLLGLLFGSFFFTMKPVDVDTALPLRKQLREQYRHFIPEVLGTARNFAKLGAVYSLIECAIDRCMQERAEHDTRSAVYAGCATGALLAAKGGPRAMAGGCAVFGAFSALVEKLQPFASAIEH